MLRPGQFDTLRPVAAWLVLLSRGCSLSGIPEQEPLLHWTGQDTLGGVGVGLMVLLAMLLSAGQRLPLLWIAGAAALLWCATRGPTWPAGPSRWGDWSDGLYPYAFPVQQLWVAQGQHHKGVVLYTAVCSASALALAWASWRCVEKLALAWKPRSTP